VGSTPASATGWMKSEIGCQSPANWNQPPKTESTASAPTVQAIHSAGIVWPGRWRCSRTNGEGSPPKTMKIIRDV
jgi:hypothetical protein